MAAAVELTRERRAQHWLTGCVVESVGLVLRAWQWLCWRIRGVPNLVAVAAVQVVRCRVRMLAAGSRSDRSVRARYYTDGTAALSNRSEALGSPW